MILEYVINVECYIGVNEMKYWYQRFINRLKNRIKLAIWVLRYPDNITMLRHELYTDSNDYGDIDKKHLTRHSIKCRYWTSRFFNNCPVK